MNCEDFGKYLDNYESLTEFQKSEMTDHASMCEKCQAELDFFLSMLATAKALPKIEPPADFMQMLNARLDAEDRKALPKRIVYHVRRNWKQYATIAACFALVAVLTANRGILLDRIEGNEDGVITEETVTTGSDNGDNAYPDGTAQKPEETAAAVPVQTDENPAETDNSKAKPSLSGARAAVTAAPTVTAVNTQHTASETEKSQPSNRAAASSPQTQAPVINSTAEVYTEPVQQNAPAAVAEQTAAETEQAAAADEPAAKADGYSIALAGNIQNETASVDYDIKADAVAQSLNPDDVKASYSLATRDDNLALGRYYRIDKDGNPIDEDNEPKAIGSLNISSEDAERAMDVINQYPHGEAGGTYTTDSASFSLMLSMLSSEGISYTNYTPAGSGDVKFIIVFN